MLLLLGIALSSCREITIKTTINPDGSFTRVITVSGDSSEVIKTDLPYPVDSSWMRELYADTSDSTQYICTYTKSYNSEDLLNDELRNDTSWRKQIQRDVEISKRFMFFYSFIRYKQVYKAANPMAEDYHGYLSNEDLLWLSEVKTRQSKRDSIRYDSADARLEKYWVASMLMEITDDLKKGLDQFDEPGLKDFELSLYRDSLEANVIKWSGDGYDAAIDALVAWSGKQELARLHDIEPPIFQDVDELNTYIENLLFAEKYTLEAELPGLITETNASMMHGNTVSWDIAPLSFYFEDYEMTVESRVINYWAFIVAGFVFFLLLLLVIIKIFK